MRAGLLKERIIILTSVINTNQYGEEVTSWDETYTTRARLVHDSGGRSDMNGKIFYDYTKTLIIHDYVEISEFQRIKWNSRIYRILDIEPNPDDMSKTIKIQLVDD